MHYHHYYIAGAESAHIVYRRCQEHSSLTEWAPLALVWFGLFPMDPSDETLFFSTDVLMLMSKLLHHSPLTSMSSVKEALSSVVNQEV